ncbi:MAG: efflux transporter outer membrane subunit [Candidatus Palauibacterales bacterium]|nr:efflux transporter outer membrane subunit [Candidatus Palauibacterales bacterium]MDP2482358.1 efflux transporter outer membrane subunit [Candidatus Palauibacterales bacterium]
MSRSRARPRVWFVVLSVMTAGCTVGPDYEPPDFSTATVPDQWRTAVETEMAADTTDLEMWWVSFNDSLLTDLIRRAELGNLSLQAAVGRVVEARAIRGAARGGYYPDIVLGGAYSYQKVSENGVQGGSGASLLADPFDSWSFGLDLSWEIDLFGKVRRTVESATAQLQASVEDYRDVLVTMYAEVGSAYVDARAFQVRLDFASQNVEAQRNSLQLTRDRFRAGLTSALDVAQAEQNLAQTESSIPSLQIGLEASLNRLAVLLGQAPGALHDELDERVGLPRPDDQVAYGIPADLLRRRPDVRRAERQLAAQTARIGIATAQLYPSLSIGGSVGVEALSFGNLDDSGSLFWGIAPSISLPLFTGGKLKNQVRAEEARTEQALAAYEQTVLRALEEVQDALVAYGQEKQRRDRLAEAVVASQRAVDLVKTQYVSGLTNFQNYLDAQRSLFQQQDELAQSDGQVVINLIDLNRALGGGWSPYQAEVTAAAAAGQAASPADGGDR